MGIFDKALNFIDKDIEHLMTQVGEKSVEMIQEKLSTPYPPSSKPGESPHRRTGELADSICMSTHQNEDEGVLTISAGRESTPGVATWLELGSDGGKIAARPYLDPVKNQTDEIIAEVRGNNQ